MDTAPDVSLPQLAFTPILPTSDLITLAFYIIIGVYAIFTGILYYHWNAYTSDKKVAFTTFIAYFAITIPLIITMATSALIF